MNPIENKPNWFKHAHNVVNTDDRAHQEYLRKKSIARASAAKQESAVAEINNLGERVSRIEDTLSRILTLLEKNTK